VPRLIKQQGSPDLLELKAIDVPGLVMVEVKNVELPGVLETSGQVTYDPAPLDAPGPGSVLICCARPESEVILDM